ncbi:MAG TPA: hydroxymethylbilane synthase [Bauldia sp.]|nr:hydroxymethylbilane synthase [Bauldia sp.]
MQSHEIRIGTRGSPLALAQAEETRSRLAQRLQIAPEAIQIVAIKTTGDRITDRPLAEAGGKGLFTKEIDEALLDGRIDIGVHSAKDMATRLPDGIVIAATLPRQDVRDAFISPGVTRLTDLPEGAVLGTSSLRRRALALRLRPDLRVVDLRGNVDTRLRKISEGEAEATLLAAAGLLRLGLLDRVASFMETDAWLPAPGQGAIAIAAREDDIVTRQRVAMLDDRASSIALAAERAYLAVLDGSCRTPIGGLATLDGTQLTFRGIIISPDGVAAHDIAVKGAAADGERLGREAGETLLARGGPGFFVVRR